MQKHSARVAILYPGDRALRDRSDPTESRFASLFAAFDNAGVAARPAVYHDDFADEVEAQLNEVEVVLVWCNPIEGGRRRDKLDDLLRRVADRGVLVSAHPDAILALGTKDVLLAARELPFGSDAHRVDSLEQLERELPQRLNAGPRVLKQHRGHSGIGVWRVEWAQAKQQELRVRHAQRGSDDEVLDIQSLKERLAAYFEPTNGGHMIDQAWQPRLAQGMVRAYLVESRVTGFGVQAINALYPTRPGEPPPQPGPRLYHGPDLPQYEHLKVLLETQWVELLRAKVGLSRNTLPLLWDCDFMLGEPHATGDRYVLCEVNVSSVSPFPPSSVPAIVAAVQARLR